MPVQFVESDGTSRRPAVRSARRTGGYPRSRSRSTHIPIDDNKSFKERHVKPVYDVFRQHSHNLSVERVPSSKVSEQKVEAIPILKEAYTECDRMPPKLRKNMAELGWKYSNKIQQYCIPVMALSELDLCAMAETGSGKSSCYLIGLLWKLYEDLSDENPNAAHPRDECKPLALVLCPTRELVIQIAKDGQDLANNLKMNKTSVRVSSAYGGIEMNFAIEVTRLSTILVATPGRLKQMVEENSVDLSCVKYVVLDEADTLLKRRSNFDMDWLFGDSDLPKARRTFMFSATWDKNIQAIARSKYLTKKERKMVQFIQDQHVSITVGKLNGINSFIEQEIIKVSENEKMDKLEELLHADDRPKKTLVFAETRATTKRIVDRFNNEEELVCRLINSDLDQGIREKNLETFRDGAENEDDSAHEDDSDHEDDMAVKEQKDVVLVATQVAGRGLDIAGCDLVIQYDLPTFITDGFYGYIHRIGRTGRMGNKGRAIAFYDPNRKWDKDMRANLVEALTSTGKEAPEFLLLDRPTPEPPNPSKRRHRRRRPASDLNNLLGRLSLAAD